MTEQEKAAAETLGRDIAALKAAAADNGGKLSQLQEAHGRLADGLQKMQQLQMENARVNREAATPDTDNRELGVYFKADGRLHGKEAPSFKTGADHKPLRLVGGVAVHQHGTGETAVEATNFEWGILDDPNPKTKAQLQLQKAVENRALIRFALGRKTPIGHPVFTPKADRAVMEAARACGPDVAKIFADSSGIGAEWVPDTYLPELERDVMVPTGVAGIFKQRILPPGGVKIPYRSGRVRAYKGVVQTANNPPAATISTYTTGNTQTDPARVYAAVQIDRDFDEDSIIAVMPEIRSDLINAHLWARDNAIINGDSAATHQDAIASWDARGEMGGTTGLGGSDDQRRLWLGLRARAYDLTSMTTDQTAAQTYDGLRTALAKLSAKNLIAGRMTGGANVVVLVSWEYFFAKMLGWAEFQSWEKVGAYASLLTGQIGGPLGQISMLPGQVGFINGMFPVCIAYPLTADLASTGLYTGSGSTNAMLQLDRTRFEMCYRQGMRLETETLITSNVVNVVSSTREVFRAMDAVASTVKDVHCSFNLSSS